MNTKEIIGIVGLLSLFGTIVVSVLHWDRKAYRLVPFVYATSLAIVWTWSLQKSWLESLALIALTNAIAGGLLFAAWLQMRQK